MILYFYNNETCQTKNNETCQNKIQIDTVSRKSATVCLHTYMRIYIVGWFNGSRMFH